MEAQPPPKHEWIRVRNVYQLVGWKVVDAFPLPTTQDIVLHCHKDTPDGGFTCKTFVANRRFVTFDWAYYQMSKRVWGDD